MRKKTKKFFLVILGVAWLLFSSPSIFQRGNVALAAGATYDLATSTSYNLRFDGAAGLDLLAAPVTTADLDNDGKQDILAGAEYADYGSRQDCGTVYVIFNTLIDDYSATDNNIDLSSSSNYNLKYVGANASDELYTIATGDLDDDGKQDLLLGSRLTDHNGNNSGSLYVIYNTLIDDYSGTGNVIDLSISSNYNLRYDGSANEAFAGGVIYTSDLDNDSKQDIVAGSSSADFNDRDGSGSLYVIYNTLIDDYSGTGNNINLGTASNYNLRYDGAYANDRLGWAPYNDYHNFNNVDLDNNGRQDLLIGANYADFGGPNYGSLYIIYDDLINNYSGTGHNIDMRTASNYNLRYDGATKRLTDWFAVADLDNDGKQDLLIGASGAGGTHAARLFIIYNTLIDDYSGTGNNIALSDSSQYNLCYIEGLNTSFPEVTVADFDNDGKQDILTGSSSADYNSRSASGSLYIIYNTLIDDYSGTGNEVNLLNDTSSYNLRYDGANAGDGLGSPSWSSDLNNDGKPDLLVGAFWASYNSRSWSGSLYVIYNFPHSIGLRSSSSSAGGGPKDLSGSITASDSVTKIKKVQSSLDDSQPRSSSWTDCSSSDGGFDSRSESFFCDLTSLSGSFVEGTHHLYVRAYDTNNSFTSQARYTQTIEVDKTTPEITNLSLVNIKTLIQGGKVYQLPETERTLSFSGEAHEYYSSFSNQYPKLASGLDILTIQVNQLNSGENPQSTNPQYTQYLSQDYSLTDPLIVSDTKDEKDKEKFARFFVTLPHPLPDGYFQIKISLKDKAQNNFDYSPFYLSLNYSLTPTPIPTPIQKRTSLILEEKKIPVETEEEKERIKEEGVTLQVQVKVVDKQTQPIQGAKVTLYSEPRTTHTNNQGIATFHNVPQGEHQVVIAYKNYQSEKQSIRLDEPDIKTYEITVRVEEVGKAVPWRWVLGGIFLGLVLTLVFFWLVIFRKRK